jgi:putative mRNA 3-end processing factor
MKYKFLGGAVKIGSTGLLLQTENSSNMFEYGITPSDPPTYPIRSPPVDNVFLTHAHLDHSGMTPWLTQKFDLTLYSTELTLAIAQILLRDNIKICDIEGYPCMYSKSDIRTMVENAIKIEIGSTYKFRDFDLKVHSAGHIPGSVMFELDLINGPDIIFTSDINTIDTQLVTGIGSKKCDVLFLETTYAGRDHELRQKIEYRFKEKVREIVERGGHAIIPAFAVGRTQEVLLNLADLDYNIYLDGLGGTVTRLILKYPEYIRNDKKLRKLFNKVNRVRSKAHREKAFEADVIITTSGMLDGGPVLSYIQALNNNPKNGVLLTGYQVEGSNGRMLLEEGKININGTTEKINVEVEHFDFSAHAGHKELLNFARGCDPEHIILFHGDDREKLKDDLEDSFTVHLPKEGKIYEI